MAAAMATGSVGSELGKKICCCASAAGDADVEEGEATPPADEPDMGMGALDGIVADGLQPGPSGLCATFFEFK
jgi:hypothetical protein